MKKIILGMIIGLLLSTSIAFATDAYNAKKATFNVYVNSEKLETNNDVLAVNGTTYMSLKDLCNALGTNIVWNEEKHRVEVGDCLKLNESEKIASIPKEIIDYKDTDKRTELVLNTLEVGKTYRIWAKDAPDDGYNCTYINGELYYNGEEVKAKTNTRFNFSISNNAAFLERDGKYYTFDPSTFKFHLDFFEFTYLDLFANEINKHPNTTFTMEYLAPNIQYQMDQNEQYFFTGANTGSWVDKWAYGKFTFNNKEYQMCWIPCNRNKNPMWLETDDNYYYKLDVYEGLVYSKRSQLISYLEENYPDGKLLDGIYYEYEQRVGYYLKDSNQHKNFIVTFKIYFKNGESKEIIMSSKEYQDIDHYKAWLSNDSDYRKIDHCTVSVKYPDFVE